MEALPFTREIRKLISKARDDIDEDAIREIAIRNGMLTLRASGRARIKAGLTSCDEVIAATAEQ